mgnify:FL=1
MKELSFLICVAVNIEPSPIRLRFYIKPLLKSQGVSNNNLISHDDGSSKFRIHKSNDVMKKNHNLRAYPYKVY